MGSTRHLGESGRPDVSPTVMIDPAGVWAEVPVAGDGGGLSCHLRVAYRVSDPLVLALVVTAPSGATVTEAVILRSDLMEAIDGRHVAAGTVVAGPAERRTFQLVFAEGRANIGVVLPCALVEDFLAATRTLVGTDDDSETDACTNAARALCDLEREIAGVRSTI